MVEMLAVFDNERMRREKTYIQSYCGKTFAVVASPYKETIIFDVDVLFFRDPAEAFTFPGYLESGMLLMPDAIERGWNSLAGDTLLERIDAFVPEIPSDYRRGSRVLSKNAPYRREQAAGEGRPLPRMGQPRVHGQTEP
jgi:hypothetical protein